MHASELLRIFYLAFILKYRDLFEFEASANFDSCRYSFNQVTICIDENSDHVLLDFSWETEGKKHCNIGWPLSNVLISNSQ